MSSALPEDWEMVVGLEVHVELKTATKLFCGCPNNFGDEPNTNVCPVCLGLPGSLPVLNEAAVELAMRVGLALNCQVLPSVFHRKNYFYPDMPKDYQISQYDQPINVGGWLDLPSGKKVGIVRAHLEEDTGKTTHVGGGGRIHEANHSLVDYNRAGVPLVEIVSAPDISSADEARTYVEELRAVLIATGASDGKMEEGSLRVDANVSVRRVADSSLGTRTEIKNLNSLRSLGRAIDYEAARQVSLLTQGRTIVQQTRHWDEASGSTGAMRSKEEAYDYRYFPEPDLVPLAPGQAWLERVRGSLPELPASRRARVGALAGLPASSDAVVTVVRHGLDPYLWALGQVDQEVGALALRRLANEVTSAIEALDNLSAEAFVTLVHAEAGGSISPAAARGVLKRVLETGEQPEQLIAQLQDAALSRDDLEALVDRVIADHPKEWERYRNGEDKLMGFFVGALKQASEGRADSKAASAALRARR